MSGGMQESDVCDECVSVCVSKSLRSVDYLFSVVGGCMAYSADPSCSRALVWVVQLKSYAIIKLANRMVGLRNRRDLGC